MNNSHLIFATILQIVLRSVSCFESIVDSFAVETDNVEKWLSSKCYNEQPNFDRGSNTWGFNLVQLMKIVDDKIISDAEICPNLGLCPKLRPWMIEKKVGAGADEDQNKKRSFDEIQAKSYKEVPKSSEKEPLKVFLSFFIESVSGFSEVDQEFGVGTFVRYEWNVTLKKCRRYLRAMGHLGVSGISISDFEDDQGNDLAGDLDWGFFVKLESTHYPIFWMPDIFLENAKSVSRQLSTFETNYLDLSGIKKNDEPTVCSFSYIERFAATVPCDMNFLYYPIDAQNCEIRFRSFEYSTKDVVPILKQQDLSDDVKKGLGDQYANLTGSTKRETIFEHEYSVISLKLRIQRTIVSVLVGTIVPSLLIVAISFSSFWLGLDYLGDRINIGMICLLAVLAQFSQTRGNLPPTAYVTFMDYWMILCIFSIVFQLLQTSLVYFVYNYQQTRVIKKKHEEEIKEERQRTLFARTVAEKTTSTARWYVGEQLRERRLSRPVDHDHDDQSKMSTGERESSGKETEQSPLTKKLIKFERMLFEPPVKKTSTRYIPMKIDSVTRVLFPFSFMTCTFVYWVILLRQRDSKYHVF